MRTDSGDDALHGTGADPLDRNAHHVCTFNHPFRVLLVAPVETLFSNSGCFFHPHRCFLRLDCNKT